MLPMTRLLAEIDVERARVVSLRNRAADLASSMVEDAGAVEPADRHRRLLAESSMLVASLVETCSQLDILLGGVESQLVGTEGGNERYDEYVPDLLGTRRALVRAEARAERAESKLNAIEKSRAWRAVRGYWRFRDRMRTGDPPNPVSMVNTETVVDPLPAQTLDGRLVELRKDFEAWIEGARRSGGGEVVIMFADDRLKAPNRSTGLTRVYLDDECPVFFNGGGVGVGGLSHSEAGSLLFESTREVSAHLLVRLLEADFGAKEKTLFVSFPHELIVRYMLYASQHGWRVVYDVQSDWEEVSRIGGAGWYESEFEWYIARQADLVTAVSWPLARKIEAMSERPVVVNTNAHDATFPARTPAVDPERTVIGYSGHATGRWFNWDLMIGCAKRYPDVEFQLAGLRVPARFQPPENVKLLGHLSDEELVAASSSWVASVLPLEVGPLADSLDPIEIYEYVHMGLPTLATYLPQVRSYPGVMVVESREAFVDAIPDLVEQGLQGMRNYQAWLAENTWEDRVRAYRVALLDVEDPRPLLSYLLGRGY